jgi:hypothetical protein
LAHARHQLSSIKPAFTFQDSTFIGNENAHMLAGFRVPLRAKCAMIYAKAPYTVADFVRLGNGGSTKLTQAPIGKVTLDFYGK